MPTSHWPTFADGLFWCACDNRTFDTEDEWLAHAARAYFEDRAITVIQPSESSSRHAAPSR